MSRDSVVAAPSEAEFARALLDARLPCPDGLRACNGADPAARYAVHRNNVVGGLAEALADTFAVVRELVGADFFDAMARRYVRADPPASPVLALYGEGFPAFVQGFEPARSLPYLADVASLEWLRQRALHAADAAVLSAPQIARHLADPTALPGARVVFHPSADVLRSPCAVVSLWAAHQGLGDIAAVDPAQPESALVLRQDATAAVIALDPAAALFMRCLLYGVTLGEACAEAAALAGFDLAASLRLLIVHGALSAWHAPQSLAA